jgi:hypothetical protein
LLGSDDVGVARIEWKYPLTFLVAASPCCMVLCDDPHLLHVSPLAAGFDLCSSSIAVDGACVVDASGHLWFRLAGSA